jgi:lipid-binding SYLF domain-containing protein
MGASLGCGGAPATRAQAIDLEARADATLEAMERADPSLAAIVASAEGYVVFPRVGEGGFIVGGSSGVGVVYERGRPIGYAQMREASIGAQVGGQSFSELIVLADRGALERVIAGNFDLRADARATAIRADAAASTSLEGGTAVFVYDAAGLMAQVAVGGQRIEFHPRAP